MSAINLQEQRALGRDPLVPLTNY